MDFSTSLFWLALLAAVIVLLAGNGLLRKRDAARRVFHKLWLAATSLALLGLASWVTLVIFLGVAAVSWVGCYVGLKLPRGKRKVLLAGLVPLLLSPLFIYKYSGFVCNGIFGMGLGMLEGLLIPIGLSFYSFQLIGFCVDTLLGGKPLPKPLDFLNFGAFFPQVVAGPIERRDDLLPQMQAPDLRLRSATVAQGVPYIILGLFFKMVLADNLADAFITDTPPNAAYAYYAGGNALTVWADNLIYTFSIYFDYAGYCLIAFGLAHCMGVRITLNFLSPYTCTNASNFWRTWNISLFRWFKEYIYIPLGGNRTRWALGTLLLVFIVSGIWHGAGWNFILWGVLAGVLVLIHHLFKRFGGHLPKTVGWVFTFFPMVLVWMFFYDKDLGILGKHLKLLASPGAYNPGGFMEELIRQEETGTLVIPFLGLSTLVIGLEALSKKLYGHPYKIFLSPVACGVMVYLIVLLNTMVHSPFIYFSF